MAIGSNVITAWKAVSPALNARHDLPPLLLQTSDSESVGSAEGWYRLRKAGAPVEWWDYPDETHEKRDVADRWRTQMRNLDWFRFWLQGYENSSPQYPDQNTRWRTLRGQHQWNEKQIAEGKDPAAEFIEKQKGGGPR